jgi:ribosomal protein S18 acetylase RimI-like enzyme
VVENRGLRERHHDTIANVTPLDNPVWHALTGPQARFCEGSGLAVRYDREVAPFAAMPDHADSDTWAALGRLLGPGGAGVVFRRAGLTPPDGWQETFRLAGMQMVAGEPIGVHDPALVELAAADVPEMLALVGRTRPGPFFARTAELGTYLGVREDGRLVAMAGERIRCPGYTEVSAVCTDESVRKRGLATRLVCAIAAGIEARGETAMLHVASENARAIRVYEALGFATNAVVDFVLVHAPQWS